MEEIFEGKKVIKIISDKTLVLNAGSNDGINKDDMFEIPVERKISVTDPYSGKHLGSITCCKARIIVVAVCETICVCQNAECYDDVSSTKSPMPLNVDTTQISGGFEDLDFKIHIGDKVLKIKKELEE